MTENDFLETKGRWAIHLKLYAVIVVLVVIAELIGIHTIPLGRGGMITLLPICRIKRLCAHGGITCQISW